jgi:hypothetical protein
MVLNKLAELGFFIKEAKSTRIMLRNMQSLDYKTHLPPESRQFIAISSAFPQQLPFTIHIISGASRSASFRLPTCKHVCSPMAILHFPTLKTTQNQLPLKDF